MSKSVENSPSLSGSEVDRDNEIALIGEPQWTPEEERRAKRKLDAIIMPLVCAIVFLNRILSDTISSAHARLLLSATRPRQHFKVSSRPEISDGILSNNALA